MKRHIVIDARMFFASGVGTYLQNILPALTHEYRVTSLCTDRVAAEMPSGTEIVLFNAPIYSPSEQFYLRRSIPSCDLFWAPHFNAPLLPIRAKQRLVTIHDVFHLDFIQDFSFAQKAYVKLLYLNAASRSSAIITVSHFSADRIRHFFPKVHSKVHVILNSADRGLFNADISQARVEDLIQKNRLPSKYFALVGNIKPHKNLKCAVDAFQAYLKSDNYRGEHLVIVGKKEGFVRGDSSLFKLIESSPSLKKKICFTGYLPNALIPPLYKGAAALIFPSLYEGFGLPPLEAHLCGTRVICSDIPSVREIMGPCAQYFDPLDSNALLRELAASTHPTGCAHEWGSWQKSQQAHVDLINQILF